MPATQPANEGIGPALASAIVGFMLTAAWNGICAHFSQDPLIAHTFAMFSPVVNTFLLVTTVYAFAFCLYRRTVAKRINFLEGRLARYADAERQVEIAVDAEDYLDSTSF